MQNMQKPRNPASSSEFSNSSASGCEHIWQSEIDKVSLDHAANIKLPVKTHLMQPILSYTMLVADIILFIVYIGFINCKNYFSNQIFGV